MAPEKANSTRLYFALSIGLILGVAVAASTGQWWWSTVGALAGAAVGGVADLVRRRG